MLDLGSVAIDTNVIIYAFDQSDFANHKRETARSLLQRAGRYPLRLPLQVAAESFRVLTGRFGWDAVAAQELLTTLLENIPHVRTSRESTLTAFALCAGHGIALWNALILSAASSAGCGLVLTEDAQNLRRFDPPDVPRTVWILNPFLEENRAALEALGALPP